MQLVSIVLLLVLATVAVATTPVPCPDAIRRLAIKNGNSPTQTTGPKASPPTVLAIPAGSYVQETTGANGARTITAYVPNGQGTGFKVYHFEMANGQPMSVAATGADLADLPAGLTPTTANQTVVYARERGEYSQLTWFTPEAGGQYRVRTLTAEQGRDVTVSERRQAEGPVTASIIARANRELNKDAADVQAAIALTGKVLKYLEIDQPEYVRALADARAALPNGSSIEHMGLAVSIATVRSPRERQLAWIARARGALGYDRAKTIEVLNGRRKDDPTLYEEIDQFFMLVKSVEAMKKAGHQAEAQRIVDELAPRIPGP